MADPSDVIAFDQTTDAALWADAFLERFVVYCNESYPGSVNAGDPKGLMTSWFANAIERGRTAGSV